MVCLPPIESTSAGRCCESRPRPPIRTTLVPPGVTSASDAATAVAAGREFQPDVLAVAGVHDGAPAGGDGLDDVQAPAVLGIDARAVTFDRRAVVVIADRDTQSGVGDVETNGGHAAAVADGVGGQLAQDKLDVLHE